MSPARIENGAEGGIVKEEYWFPTSRCRSDSTWNDDGDLLNRRRSFFMVKAVEMCILTASRSCRDILDLLVMPHLVPNYRHVRLSSILGCQGIGF